MPLIPCTKASGVVTGDRLRLRHLVVPGLSPAMQRDLEEANHHRKDARDEAPGPHHPEDERAGENQQAAGAEGVLQEAKVAIMQGGVAWSEWRCIFVSP